MRSDRWDQIRQDLINESKDFVFILILEFLECSEYVSDTISPI